METTIISEYTGETLCHLEEICGDNIRPGMPKEGWLCRYNLSQLGANKMLRRYTLEYNGKTYVTRGANAEDAFYRFANRPVFGRRTMIDNTTYRLEMYDADTQGERWASFIIENEYRITCKIIED